MRLATVAVLGNALFEIFVGLHFLFSPAPLHNGHTPSAGFETYAFECFGLGCLGMAMTMLVHGDALLKTTVVWHGVFAVFLATYFFNQPWRKASYIDDSSWAVVPMIVHVVLGVLSAAAAPSLDKSKSE